MELRDYFAARAMTACYAEYCAHANVQGYEEDWKMGVALDSYAMADAMLKARDRGVGQSENDRRVAACLDALKHVSTEDLESGRVQSIGLRLFDAEKQRDELREALQALVDAAWLEDSHAVRFDGTVMFSPGYDFSGIDGGRRAEFREEDIEFVVWPAGDAGGNWSAYSTYDGSLWFELFETEDEAREQCMKLLDQVMPDHPISKARAALAATGEPQ